MRKFLWLLLVCLISLTTPVLAEVGTDIGKTIEELQRKITELQGQESSLAKQITLLNSQISLSTLKISATKTAINKLSGEIDELSQQIDELEQLKTKRLELVIHRAPLVYKYHAISSFGRIFLSQNFSDFINRIKYLTRIQEEDTKLYKQLQLTQTNYNERKDEREKKKATQEALKKQLEAETRELERQKKEKQTLLEQTKNSEAVYQKLLAQALAEKLALERAIIEGVQIGPIKRGEPIALVGNTGYPGCSTGPHLHFEVRKNNLWMDPADYLGSKSVKDDQDGGEWTVGRGEWSWPLEDTIRLTQHFGKTPYSWRYSYSGGIHTGFDMVSTGSDVIRAPKDGTLYSSSQSCGGSSIIKIKYIDHGDSLLSFYLHVQ